MKTEDLIAIDVHTHAEVSMAIKSSVFMVGLRGRVRWSSAFSHRHSKFSARSLLPVPL